MLQKKTTTKYSIYIINSNNNKFNKINKEKKLK